MSVKSRFTCGEIILEKTDKYEILYGCILCDKEMIDVSEFIGHMLMDHLNINNIDTEESLTKIVELNEALYEKEPTDLYNCEEIYSNIYILDKDEATSTASIQGDPQDFSVDIKIEEIHILDEYEEFGAVREDENKSIEYLQSSIEDLQPSSPKSAVPSETTSTPETQKITKKNHPPIATENIQIKQLKYNRYKRETDKSQKNDKSRKHACEFCAAVFRDASNLNVHRKRHLGKKSHSCTMCEKAFISTTELKHHMRSHTSERPFVCEECGLSYFSSSQLSGHRRRRHLNERRYPCEICNKSFYDKRGLEDHSYCHTKERAFKCSVCESTFPRRKGLAQHMKLHSDVKNYLCKICGKTFAQHAGLYSHMKRHNLVKTECELSKK